MIFDLIDQHSESNNKIEEIIDIIKYNSSILLKKEKKVFQYYKENFGEYEVNKNIYPIQYMILLNKIDLYYAITKYLNTYKRKYSYSYIDNDDIHFIYYKNKYRSRSRDRR
jgi:hypothetical protein